MIKGNTSNSRENNTELTKKRAVKKKVKHLEAEKLIAQKTWKQMNYAHVNESIEKE